MFSIELVGVRKYGDLLEEEPYEFSNRKLETILQDDFESVASELLERLRSEAP